MKLIFIFYACLRLPFLDVVTNPDPLGPVPGICRILCSTVRALAGNLSDLIEALSQYDILARQRTVLQSILQTSGTGRKTLVSDML